jgi:hypothetical protein
MSLFLTEGNMQGHMKVLSRHLLQHESETDLLATAVSLGNLPWRYVMYCELPEQRAEEMSCTM